LAAVPLINRRKEVKMSHYKDQYLVKEVKEEKKEKPAKPDKKTKKV